jgi:hypothetical protein
MPYIYENHLGGGLYASEDKLSFEQTYCDVCGDSDWELGFASTKDEARELLNGDYAPKYLREFLNRTFAEDL